MGDDGMRTSTVLCATAAAAGFAFLASAPAFAGDSLSDSVEQFLNNVQTKVDDTKIWKFHIKPSLRESVIWTDNVYLNDDNEQDLHLTRVTNKTTGASITDPAQLEQIASTLPEFQDAKSVGRDGDFIIQSELGLDLVAPVNDATSKAFKHDHLTILGVKLRNQEYLDRNELDNNSVFLHTDLFGFLTDIMNQEWGNRVWMRVRDDYSYLRDPLDTEIRVLGQTGITGIKHFNDFGRTENTFSFDTGIHGNEVDASVGYERYNLWLSSEDLQQAQHSLQTFRGEVGAIVPGTEGVRAYVRYEFGQIRFDEAPIHDAKGHKVGNAQILNDGDINKGTIGAEWHNEKIDVLAESAYENWKPRLGSGLSGDTNQFAGVVSHVQLAYKPWEEQNTKFQLEYVQTVDYSAISNFNANQTVTFSVQHEIIPKRLDGDFNISFTNTNPSDGPYRKLLETGCGLTYHMYKQLDLTARYLFRHQTAHGEIITNSDFQQGDTLYSYQIASDSAFYQNIVELGFVLHF
jgi:hypothetical protein